MFLIGISLVFFIFIAFIGFFTFILPLYLSLKNHAERKAPQKISYFVVGLLVAHWVFFLLNGYALISESIADRIFMPLWIVLCIAVVFTAIYEFKNNKLFAIPMAGFSVISLLFSAFIYGISNM